MNKAVLLLVLAIAGAIATNPVCQSTTSCSGVGGNCGTVASTSITGAYNIYECKYQTFCDTTKTGSVTGTNQCSNLIAVGGDCSAYTTSTDAVCAGSSFCNTTSKVCQAIVNNVAANGNCTALTAGCVAGYSCTYANGSSTCQPFTPVTGQACSVTQICQDASSCIGGTCIAYGTVKTGSSCTSTFDCVAGDWCNAGTCAAAASSSKASCSTAGTIVACTTAGETCVCANPGGSANEQCVAEGTLAQGDINNIIAAVNCELKNCPEYGSCSNCNSQICATASAQGKLLPGTQIDTCGTPCSPAVAVAASFALVVVAAFFAL